jgi:hypothetical protein
VLIGIDAPATCTSALRDGSFFHEILPLAVFPVLEKSCQGGIRGRGQEAVKKQVFASQFCC